MKEQKLKNRIITISGEPVSGKGTTIKELIKQLETQGYSRENIHLESTGNDFRRYFNSIIDLIRNINNSNEMANIKEREEIQRIINCEEYRKILSKTIAKLIKSNTDVTNFSIEDANNREDFAEIRNIVDTLIDEGMKQRGIEINNGSHPNEIWIIDSRLAFNNIPKSFSVRLTTTPKIAGERLFNDRTRGNEDSNYKDIKEAMEEREKRRLGENKRYMKRYGVDLTDEDNYKLIIDTSYSTPTEIADTIIKCVNCYEKNEDFSKKWASPKIFLPLQHERDTLGGLLYTFEDMIKSINELGYLPNKNIEVINVDGLNYIIEGHHRNFAAAYVGKTLVPYEVIAKDDEQIEKYTKNTAREVAEREDLSNIIAHEWMIAKTDKNFQYRKIFPELIQKLTIQEQR
ncbi:MAG: ParB N-terminal domain-containing protein [Clostridia bacterium]|nr:ParB N-terminal domain-containing protein [Clostridia bacterium]